MRILSWNANGLGNLLKWGKVKAIVCRADPNIVFFQETKLMKVDRFLVRIVWDDQFNDWEFIPSSGSLGVLWILDLPLKLMF